MEYRFALPYGEQQNEGLMNHRPNEEEADMLVRLGETKEHMAMKYPEETEAQILHRFKKAMANSFDARLDRIIEFRASLFNPDSTGENTPAPSFDALGIIERGQNYVKEYISSIWSIWLMVSLLIRIKPASYPPMHRELKEWEERLRQVEGHLDMRNESESTLKLHDVLFNFLFHEVSAIYQDFAPFKELWLSEASPAEEEGNAEVRGRGTI